MTNTSGISPCFAFHYQYDGPNPSHDTSPFTIHCTLGKGAEAYYSGIRVVIFAKKTGYSDDFAKAEVQTRRPAGRHKMIAGNFVTVDPPEGKDEVLGVNALSNDSLPLCTLVFELVDLSGATWSVAEIRLARTETSTTGPVQIPDTHRVLYEYAKLTTMDSPSCFLLLATRYAGLRHRLKPNNPSRIVCAYPAQIGPPVHGFQILPPSEKRPLFAQPPPEILYTIFSIIAWDGDYYSNWRKGLVSVGLVCRAWLDTALCVVYEDFDRSSQIKPDIGQLATALENNPMWGRHIKLFSPYCFANGGPAGQLQGNALTILKTAVNMRRLSMGDVSAILIGDFVDAFCKMSELGHFIQYSSNGFMVHDEDPEKTYLNAAQLAKCFAHWPKLRRVTVHKFGQPLAEDSVFAPARCALEQIKFEHGIVPMAQLRAMTASSQDSLHSVVLKSIRGISNKELASWLIDFGANFTSLELESNVFTRSEAEELAIDAAIHNMPKLFDLKIEGAVATVLTLLRFEPIDTRSKYRARRRIQIRDPVLFDPHAFVIALRTTKWEDVEITGLRMSEENSELAEEGKRVANERGIHLWMRT